MATTSTRTPAIAGLGIALAPQQLVQRELLERRLLAPLGFTAGQSVFALCVLESRTEQAGLAALRDWMMEQSREGRDSIEPAPESDSASGSAAPTS